MAMTAARSIRLLTETMRQRSFSSQVRRRQVFVAGAEAEASSMLRRWPKLD
jgi:hypothetical protein